MMPGPLLTITISESSQRGFFIGPALILGHAILELILVIALLFGLAPFFKNLLFLPLRQSLVLSSFLGWLLKCSVACLP